VTAKCRKFPNLKTSAPSLAESKAKADAEVRRRIDDSAARVEHFANRGFDWWEAA
jgi:hypothetical protein